MPEPQRYKKVLVVDDTAVDRLIAKKIIEKSGFAASVVGVEGGQAALDHLIANQDDLPELIFLDINMPLMSGFDFLDEYHKLPEALKKRSVVILSSSLNDIDKSKASSNPYVINFLSKPLNSEMLEQVLLHL